MNNCVEIMDMCDEITLTCDFMRKLFQSKLTNQNVTVIPNFVPYNWMGYLFDQKAINNVTLNLISVSQEYCILVLVLITM